jgi:DNA polymerase elongation subunit (family B)
MIGYNIMGFDWKFIIERAQELGIKDKFLKLLSKNNQQKTKKMIKHKEVKVASGTHKSTYVEMEGRIQIDLYSHYRKEENLASYKLDNVSSYFIGDGVKKTTKSELGSLIQSNNLMGIKNGDYISFEILGNSTDMYMDGKKFPVKNVDQKAGTFEIEHELDMSNNKLRWCLNKDDITLEEMFNADTPKKRAKVAKYCFQDCNLLHNLMRKCDILTGFIEFSAICKIPMSFAIQRGQGIKLLSFIAYKCGKKGTLMPDLEKAEGGQGYEGAICLTPKTGFYPDNPIAVNDYSSLYPSCMVSENISHDSKVWTKEYDLKDRMIKDTGEKDEEGNYIYDNLKGYKYVDIKFDTYRYIRKTLKGAQVKELSGYKICRYIQFKEDKKGIMPSVLTELLAARKATKKLKKDANDPFMKSVYDKRQLGIKVVANSLYGQCGARTSAFYDIDIAASTTATGRKLLMYAKSIVEDCYSGITVDTKYGKMKSDAEYIYGDTDSVFFTFNLKWAETGERVVGKEALDVTIELAKGAGELATSYLKVPHDLEYEKTFMPFLLLAKKKYVGMLYENDINYCKRKSMGIVLKRRDNAPCVKDSYGGVVDILMNQCNANEAVKFIKSYLDDMINEKIPMNKLIITKKLNGYYKNPKQIAHKVLADRMGERDPGNKPSVGSRLPFVYIKTKRKVKLQGERIEHPEYINKNKLKPDYEHYITNQIMKPLLQLFGLLLEQLKIFRKQKRMYKIKINGIKREFKNDHKKCQEKISKEADKRIKKLIFDEYINSYRNKVAGQRSINNFFKKVK